MPDVREIHEQRKAMEILAFMIDHVRLLFLVPNELHQACHFSYIEIGEPCTLEELSRRIPETTITNLNLSKHRRYSSNKRTKAIATISISYSIGSLSSSSSSSSSSCENILLNVNNNNKHK